MMETELHILLEGEGEETVADRAVEGDKITVSIFIGNWKWRKNVSYKHIHKRVNAFFVLEYVCGLLDSMGLWSEGKFCDHPVCKIRKMIENKMNVFFN